DRAIRERLPAGRHGQREVDDRLEVGLIEARKEEIRVGGDEQGVQIVALVRVVREADDAGAGGCDRGLEAHEDRVLAVAKKLRLEAHMRAVILDGRRWLP